MVPSRRRPTPPSASSKSGLLAWTAPVVAGLPAVAVVMVYGELSWEALAAVGVTGTALATVGLVRRAGEAAPTVGRRGLAWLVWATAAFAWELATLAADSLVSLSDLLDPVLAHPLLRGAAAVGWLLAGAWLLTRPRRVQVPS